MESCSWSNTLQGQLPDFQAPPCEVFVHLTSFFTTFVKEPEFLTIRRPINSQYNSTTKKRKLENFDNLLNEITRKYEDDFPDVPEILNSEEWLKIMNEADKLSTEIKIVWKNS